jgi:hypothetical protein
MTPPAHPLRILIVNNSLEARGGSELWVRDVARALRARGHAPMAYSRRLGAVAVELRGAGVPVFDRLEAMPEPDLLHCHHHLETMTAVTRFPGVPAIFVCHGWLPAEEAPPVFPRIYRYVAVDDLVRERLVVECGISPDRVETIRNFVDLVRFAPRSPLPPRPRRALVFSNRVAEDNVLGAIRAGCDSAGVTLETAGIGSGRVLERPEEHLPSYDVIFAKGRAALEAAAVGAFVVLCDVAGLGPALTPRNYSDARRFNFGAGLLTAPVTESKVANRLGEYDPAQARAVQTRVRAEAGLETAVDRLLELYREVIAESAQERPDPAAELRAVSRYLRWGPLQSGDLGKAERDRLVMEIARLAGALEAHRTAQAEWRSISHAEAALRQELTAARSAAAAAADELAVVSGERAAAQEQLDWIRQTTAWRLRERLLSSPRLLALYRRLRAARQPRVEHTATERRIEPAASEPRKP